MRHARFPKLLGPVSQCEHTPSSRIAYRYSSTILMPFLKHNDPSTQVADANNSSHKCLAAGSCSNHALVDGGGEKTKGDLR